MDSIKKYDQFINEELEQTTENMEKTAQTYNKYKGQVVSSIDPENIAESEQKFEDFIDGLPDDEKAAADMLRSLFSSEMIKVAIEKLQNDKKKIEEQIQARMDELKKLQSSLN